MTESLESTEARRLQLVGDVAHELCTPLATLDGYLEGLQEGLVRPDEEPGRCSGVSSGRLTHLIDDLQALWREELHAQHHADS